MQGIKIINIKNAFFFFNSMPSILFFLLERENEHNYVCARETAYFSDIRFQ